MSNNFDNTKNLSITSLFVDCVNVAYDLQTQKLKKTKFSNLSISEVHVLEAIELEYEPTMTNVASRLYITLSSLTTAIKKLEEKQMVIKERSAGDKRVIYLSLTKLGEEALMIHNEIHDEIDQIVLECIDEKDRTWVYNKIKEVCDAIKSLEK